MNDTDSTLTFKEQNASTQTCIQSNLLCDYFLTKYRMFSGCCCRINRLKMTENGITVEKITNVDVLTSNWALRWRGMATEGISHHFLVLLGLFL